MLYGESHPADHLLGPLVPFDIASDPEVLIIMGTSLKVHGLKKVIRDFAKAVHSRKDRGRVIFVNRESPAESIWDGIIDDYVSMDCDDWVHDLRSRREDLWLRQGELDLKATKAATKRKRKPTDSGMPAKRRKVTVEIPKRMITPKKAKAIMGISNVLNPETGLTPKQRLSPIFTASTQLRMSLAQAQPDPQEPDTPSKSRTFRRPNIDSPIRRILSPLVQQRPEYSPMGQPQFMVHADKPTSVSQSHTFKKPAVDSPIRQMLSPLQQIQPTFSPMSLRSFKPFVRNDMSIFKSPTHPQWSPFSTPSRSPLKMQVFRDAENGLEIQESNEEEDDARRERESSVKENDVPDAGRDAEANHPASLRRTRSSVRITT